jgi:glycosyltransferase involved in cell wall biosynthesis
VTHASGRYIALLDDDDEWHSHKLQRQVDLMDETGPEVGVVYCGYEIRHAATGRQHAQVRPVHRGQIAEAMLLQGQLTATSTVLVRRECFDRVGGFNTSLRYGEDFDMWLRVAHQYRFEFVDEVLASVHFQREGLTQNVPAIISWTETHLTQYRQFFERHAAVYANRLQKLGTLYCFNGDLRNGRQAFRRDLYVDRFAVKNYACLALTLLGSRAFRASYLVRDRMIDLMA